MGGMKENGRESISIEHSAGAAKYASHVLGCRSKGVNVVAPLNSFVLVMVFYDTGAF